VSQPGLKPNSDPGLNPDLELDCDVAIVGYGPVGALSALLLAQSGLRVAILERSRKAVDLPRAVGLDGESMRAFQRIGMSDAVHAIMQPSRETNEVCFANSKRQRLFGVEVPQFGINGWADIHFFDQPELEALLREHVAQQDRIEVMLGRQVIAIEQTRAEATLSYRCDAEAISSTLRASYVLGCDGASSFVRDAIGIDWVSLGYDKEWLVVDVVMGPEADLPLVTLQVCDPARLVTYVCVKDPNRRWEFQLLDGEKAEEMLRPEKIEALLRPWLPREHYEIRRAAVYQFHAATSSRWREGRVFLAGDAAHQTPPFLGQGLNAGFRDAVNLGWKIPRVLAGLCDERLLDSYEVERDAHARDLVERAVAVGKLMETLAAREAGKPDPFPGVESKAGYGRGRMTPPLRDGVMIEEQIGEDSPVGALLSQPIVRWSKGDARRLDELLGPEFAIVGRKESDLRMSPEARVILDRLGGRSVNLERVEILKGENDSLFDTHAAAIVRPDRYVFGVVDDDWDLDRLLLELGRKLALREELGG